MALKMKKFFSVLSLTGMVLFYQNCGAPMTEAQVDPASQFPQKVKCEGEQCFYANVLTQLEIDEVSVDLSQHKALFSYGILRRLPGPEDLICAGDCGIFDQIQGKSLCGTFDGVLNVRFEESRGVRESHLQMGRLSEDSCEQSARDLDRVILSELSQGLDYEESESEIRFYSDRVLMVFTKK